MNKEMDKETLHQYFEGKARWKGNTGCELGLEASKATGKITSVKECFGTQVTLTANSEGFGSSCAKTCQPDQSLARNSCGGFGALLLGISWTIWDRSANLVSPAKSDNHRTCRSAGTASSG